MDSQATKVFQPTAYAKLLFVMKNAGLPVAGLLAGYAIYAKGVDVGMIILISVFIIMFLAASLKACTSTITVTPIAVAISNIFTEKNIPISAIQRVRIEQGSPQISVKNTFLLIETREGKNRMGATLSDDQKQDAVAYLLELIRTEYPQNYESVRQYSNNSDLFVQKNSDSAQLVDGGFGRVFEQNRTVKMVLLLPFVLMTVILLIDTKSFLPIFFIVPIAIPVILWMFKKFIITQHGVVKRSLFGSKSIPLGTIRVAKIQSGLKGGAYLLIKTDRSKFKMGNGIVGDQLNDALNYLLEQIRVNHPENYEIVRQSSLSENRWRK